MAEPSEPITGEDLDRQLNDILDVMEEAGREADGLAQQERLDRTTFPTREAAGEPREAVVRRLKEYLEEEIPVAPRLRDDTEIDPWEEEREIAKRALANLKLAQLRSVAEEAGVPKSGTRDVLLERIVRRYRADEAEIARLVVTHERDVRADARHTTRLFPIDIAITSDTEGRIRNFVGRYFKVGIAQWFLFHDVVDTNAGSVVRGTHRSYRVQASAVGEDELSYELLPKRQDARASALLRPNSNFVEIHASGLTESRALARAVELVGGLRRREHLVSDLDPQWDDLAEWDIGTLVMLDLLQTTFRSEHVQVANLTMAGFEMGPTTSLPDEDPSSRPQVRSVRFHGQHILDSRPACELVVENERLTHVALTARFMPNPSEAFLMPVRLSMESDHVLVITGFGGESPQVSAQLHGLLIREVERKLVSGPSDPTGLKRLMRQIQDRASEPEDPDRATMFTGD